MIISNHLPLKTMDSDYMWYTIKESKYILNTKSNIIVSKGKRSGKKKLGRVYGINNSHHVFTLKQYSNIIVTIHVQWLFSDLFWQKPERQAFLYLNMISIRENPGFYTGLGTGIVLSFVIVKVANAYGYKLTGNEDESSDVETEGIYLYIIN